MDKDSYKQWENRQHQSQAWWDRYWRLRLTPALQAYRQRRLLRQAQRQLVVDQAIDALATAHIEAQIAAHAGSFETFQLKLIGERQNKSRR